MERVKNAIKQFRLKDFLAPFIFILMLVPSWVFRLINIIRNRKLWLVTEEGEARDNGYHFYRYVREEHPEDYCFYAIKPESAGYKKVERLGNVIKYGSLRHWLYYMSANLNISSQKAGNPCPIFWYFVHVTLGLYRNRVFLQHGVIKDDLTWLYYNKTKFKYFVTSTNDEYAFLVKKYGYPNGSIILTGLPRWDGLKRDAMMQTEGSILIMPTWRSWLGRDRNNLFRISDFEKTEYYKRWNGLLNNKKLIKSIKDKGVKIYFYPHNNMKKFIDLFRLGDKSIQCVTSDSEIQNYFKKCSLMITDFSSAVFDFAYLNKPIIYYQFDKDEYRKKQYAAGYFDYERDGFGDVVMEEDDLVEKIIFYIDRAYKIESEYGKRVKRTFTLRDDKNSERIYEVINGE